MRGEHMKTLIIDAMDRKFLLDLTDLLLEMPRDTQDLTFEKLSCTRKQFMEMRKKLRNNGVRWAQVVHG